LTRLHYLNFCEKLKCLSLSGCPVTKIDNFEDLVTEMLPHVYRLNGNQTSGN